MRAHNLRWWLPVVILVVVVATWAAARWMTPVLPPLRIGVNAWPGYEFLYLAQEKGFYRDAGVDVRLVEFNSLADARRAYERGQIDGLGATVIEVLQAREQPGRDLQVVTVIDYSDGADVVLARPEFTAPATLRGARIGVELGSLGVYVLVRALEHQQLSLADVKMVSLDPSAMEHAFVSGELDAVVTYPPFSLSLLKDGKAKPIFTSALIPGEVVDVIAIDESVALTRTDQVTRLLGAFQRAAAFTTTDAAEAHRIMAAREGISPAEFAAILSDGIRLVGVARQAEFLRPGGTLTTVVDRVDQVMRASKQISGPDRRAGAFSDRFVGAGSVPP